MQLHCLIYKDIKTGLYGFALNDKSEPLPSELKQWHHYQPAVYKTAETSQAKADEKAKDILTYFKQASLSY